MAASAFAARAPTGTSTFAASRPRPAATCRVTRRTSIVDASASWNFNDNLTLILEAQNLTNERNTLYIDSVREDTLFQTEIGRTYTLGATVKF